MATMDLVGNTPLIRLDSVSRLAGCNVYGKCEWMNPGGSVKDRAVRGMIEALEAEGKLDRTRASEYTLVEASGGNTAVSLAFFCRTRGYNCIVTMAENIGEDKWSLCEAAGARVVRCPLVPFTDKEKHFYHTAGNIAKEGGEKFIWTNQFENPANFGAHKTSTGPEIVKQLRGQSKNSDANVSAFVCGVGTGGTMGGVSTYLKESHPDMDTKFFVAECNGGGTKHFVETGSYDGAPSGKKTIAEGIGIGRLTLGFSQAAPHMSGGFDVSDAEIVKMFDFIMRHEGVCLGPSACLNVVGAVRVARELKLGEDGNVVTVLCDSGERYRSTLLSRTWRESEGHVFDPATLESLDWVGVSPN